jgi:hypothetical protein
MVYRISVDSILFLQVIVHFDSYTHYTLLHTGTLHLRSVGNPCRVSPGSDRIDARWLIHPEQSPVSAAASVQCCPCSPVALIRLWPFGVYNPIDMDL